jgi:hypothetical protein
MKAKLFNRQGAKNAKGVDGLLIDLNVPRLRNGIQRVVYSDPQATPVPDFRR